MIKMSRLKNVVIYIKRILSFVLLRKITSVTILLGNMEILKIHRIKLIKLLGYYGNWKAFCHMDHYQQFTNHSSDLILIMVMLFMINTTIILSTKN